MPSNAVYHHLIPQTYMKNWCFRGQSIWVYDKSTQKSEVHNIQHICGINYYHSIRAGSLYASKESLNKIWGFLRSYQISCDGEPLSTMEDMNLYYSDFDTWDIKYANGKQVNKKDRNVIKHRIQHSKDNDIEEQWNIQFENNWQQISKLLYDTIKNIHEGHPLFLTDIDSSIIMKYVVMFDWRSATGNHQLNHVLDFIDTELFHLSENAIPKKDRAYPSEETLLETLRHGYLLKTYDEFLAGKGTMQKMLELYEENLTFVFMLTSSQDTFITSDNPSFMFENSEGDNEHVFVALPNLLISLVKKDEENPDAYKIAFIDTDKVAEYNQIVFENATMILSSQQYIPKS